MKVNGTAVILQTLFYSPMKRHRDWVAVNGVFSKTPKSQRVSASAGEVELTSVHKESKTKEFIRSRFSLNETHNRLEFWKSIGVLLAFQAVVVAPLVLISDGAEEGFLPIFIALILTTLYYKLCLVLSRLRDIGMNTYWSIAYMLLTVTLIPVGLGAVLSLGFIPSLNERRENN